MTIYIIDNAYYCLDSNSSTVGVIEVFLVSPQAVKITHKKDFLKGYVYPLNWLFLSQYLAVHDLNCLLPELEVVFSFCANWVWYF